MDELSAELQEVTDAINADVYAVECYKRGIAVALYRSAGDVGFLAAPPLLGLLAEATSLSTALVVSGVLVAIGGIVFVTGSQGDPAAGRPQPAAHS